MKEVTRGLFVKDDLFSSEELVEVRSWAINNVRSGLACQYKDAGHLGSMDEWSSAASGGRIGSIHDIFSIEKNPNEIADKIIKKVYKIVEPLKLQDITDELPLHISDIFVDVHNRPTGPSLNNQNKLDWHQDPAHTLTVLIYLHEKWPVNEDWGGEFVWCEGESSLPDSIKLTKEEITNRSMGGWISCIPNRMIIDTVNINHKVDKVKGKADRLCIHGWAL